MSCHLNEVGHWHGGLGTSQPQALCSMLRRPPARGTATCPGSWCITQGGPVSSPVQCAMGSTTGGVVVHRQLSVKCRSINDCESKEALCSIDA
mmetsp:Transcript_26028/g.43418  ORF Transcript_26028/g.43418 Transcript_26028/m.43418 type:complete len:93 (-) Transcript_26028:314-592(-)|eukprot:CAMPEP_0174290802 /NCGR_PEP_ID=MMETSP0809-20121228/30189_1 /TAXON_ID=73025 ORGANISM="Eutreptiella gymnastica-like, Strain CCMP1594" /NCGR_SAMPLE_ID=MMETSP0809 /ASSEMBLY_ACC=CAM_ASM_000658 /LENGTH=92 /DNA_ID=CAMNT_0015389747 /DNA_START=218 /DNA_END=496 /DNA_ORIENTATION=+